MLPRNRDETVEESKQRIVKMVKFEEMFLKAEEYVQKIPTYMVRKCDFIDYVIK